MRVIAIRTYWAEQLIFLSKMRISAQYVRIVRIGHSYVLGSNTRVHRFGVQKIAKLKKKKSVYLAILTNFGKDMTEN